MSSTYLTIFLPPTVCRPRDHIGSLCLKNVQKLCRLFHKCMFFSRLGEVTPVDCAKKCLAARTNSVDSCNAFTILDGVCTFGNIKNVCGNIWKYTIYEHIYIYIYHINFIYISYIYTKICIYHIFMIYV